MDRDKLNKRMGELAFRCLGNYITREQFLKESIAIIDSENINYEYEKLRLDILRYTNLPPNHKGVLSECVTHLSHWSQLEFRFLPQALNLIDKLILNGN